MGETKQPEIIPQWAVSAAFNDGEVFARMHVHEMYAAMGKDYSIGERLLLENFIGVVFGQKYNGHREAAKLDSIDKWSFGKN